MPGSHDGPFIVDGAEGFLGRAIAKALLAKGLPVRAVLADAAARGPRGASPAVAPPGDAAALHRAVEGARAVVAARKLLEELPREGRTFKAFHAERTRGLLEAAAKASAGRFVYVGVAWLGEGTRGPLAEAEREAEALVARSKVPAVTVRASLVVGPGDGHVSRMAAKARRRAPALVFVGQGWAKSAPLAARDFGECVAAALLAEELPAGPLKIGGPELLTAMEIQDRLLAMHGRDKLKIHVPESIALLGAMLMEKTLRRPPVTRARLAWLLEDLVPDRTTSTELLRRRPRRFETAFAPPRRKDGPSSPA